MERIAAFETRVDREAAESVRAWDFGTVLLSPSMPQVWNANYFRVDEDADVSTTALAATARRIAVDAGLRHVAFNASERQAEALWPELEPLGYDRTRHLYLALRDHPDPPAHDVVEVTAGDVVESRAEGTREFFPGNHELVEELAELDRRLDRTIGGRWFAVREGDDVVSRAWLMQRDGIGQVEDVLTTRAKRGHGYARSVVSAAALASLDAGDELTFIVVDAGDLAVTRLYRSIGFEPLGFTERFVLPMKG